MKLPFLRAQHVSKQRVHAHANKIIHFMLLSVLARANVCSNPWNVQQARAFAHLKAVLEQSPFQAQQHCLNYKLIWHSASHG